eukprot:GAHX01000890.1.p1 GENE.GAHX01000890.1~~GAHX01000890.1.p1  ORF type:complete len:269 (+),score=39.42 GAHX01000890.1:52-807(+)
MDKLKKRAISKILCTIVYKIHNNNSKTVTIISSKSSDSKLRRSKAKMTINKKPLTIKHDPNNTFKFSNDLKLHKRLNIIMDLYFINRFSLWHLKNLNKQLKSLVQKYRNRKKEMLLHLFAPKMYNYSYILDTNWKMEEDNPTFYNEHYLSFPLIKTMIYLSPDAKKPLKDVDSKHFYIIGAFIDRNAKKGLTKEYADMFGVKCRRLPFSEHQLKNVVLTVSDVTDCLHYKMNGASWEESLKNVFPTRKLKK